MKNDVFAELVARWPSALVARGEVGRFSGGLLNSRTMANLDSAGRGPATRIKIGDRKVAYPVQDLVAWLRSRATTSGE